MSAETAAGPALGGFAKDLFKASTAGQMLDGFQTGGIAGAAKATPVGQAVTGAVAGAQKDGLGGLIQAMRATANQKPAADLKRREAEQGSIDALLAQMFPNV